jgi:hypothetical protein
MYAHDVLVDFPTNLAGLSYVRIYAVPKGFVAHPPRGQYLRERTAFPPRLAAV